MTWHTLTRPQQAALLALYDGPESGVNAGRAFAVYRNLEKKGLARALKRHKWYALTDAGRGVAEIAMRLRMRETPDDRVRRLYGEAMRSKGTC